MYVSFFRKFSEIVPSIHIIYFCKSMYIFFILRKNNWQTFDTKKMLPNSIEIFLNVLLKKWIKSNNIIIWMYN